MTEWIVRAPGVQTTVQDLGRFGYQSLGVPPAGALDRDALEIANLLVGNPRGEAALECTVNGPELECTGEIVFAVCGAPMDPRINGRSVPSWRTLWAGAGDVLSFGAAERGLRAYIAVAGGLAIRPVLGSLSTYSRAGFGGWEGRPLRVGDRLPLRRFSADGSQSAPRTPLHVPEERRPVYSPEITIRALVSHEAHRFVPGSLDLFFAQSYRVSPKSDRMGCRLEGVPLTHGRGADILSSGVQTGTVQVPGDGLPIILLADRQTTGGYTRIAHVIQADLSRLGQAKPGDTIRFERTTLEDAQEEWRKREVRITEGILPLDDRGDARPCPSDVPIPSKAARHFRITVNGTAYDVELQEE